MQLRSQMLPMVNPEQAATEGAEFGWGRFRFAPAWIARDSARILEAGMSALTP